MNRRSLIAIGAAALVAGEASATPRSTRRTVEAYLAAWRACDLAAIAACMHPDVRFTAPNAQSTGLAAYRASTARFLSLVEEVVVRADVVGSGKAMFAYDFVCRPPIGRAPTAELVHIENGWILESEIFFDVRPFEAFARGARLRP